MRKILCIEDNPNEMEKAKKAIEAAGYEAELLLIPCSKEIGGGIEVIKAAIERADGVLTDLYFNPFGFETAAGYEECTPPAGFAIVIHALGKGVPIVICSNMDDSDKENYHHGKNYSWLYDWYFFKKCAPSKKYPDYDYGPLMPTYLIREKNWDDAMDTLDILIKAKQ